MRTPPRRAPGAGPLSQKLLRGYDPEHGGRHEARRRHEPHDGLREAVRVQGRGIEADGSEHHRHKADQVGPYGPAGEDGLELEHDGSFLLSSRGLPGEVKRAPPDGFEPPAPAPAEDRPGAEPP